ncbi:MAG: ABC transporter ATP-binding protein, partial [Pseudomonadota bacterium]
MLLNMDRVVRTYRNRGAEVRALTGVTVAVEPGEFVAVTGPSGQLHHHLLYRKRRPDGCAHW